ncbi:sterol desaturase family protein [Primorskyibacter sp. S187A]|uniref:sterol desaturase family protein n=1 Tax=Primorskyibacter sp. S187A TaxID=3415130 RepID=UPI003C799BD0
MDMFLTVLTTMMSDIWTSVAGPNSRLWPFYILTTVLIAYGVYRARRIEEPFLAWLMPKRMYFHPSHIVDLKVFVVNRVFSAMGVFSFVFFGATVANMIVGLIDAPGSITPFHPIVIALMLLVVGDFATYWVHRIHHESRIFWPFHALHHSAEVMTPITVFRKHPLYDIFSSFVKGILIGTLQGLLMSAFGQVPSYTMLVGVNAGYVLFNIAGSNLRHTHVWLSFGRVVEHVFISPAQHQIHHSIAPQHHNKNYGEVLAIWDWMFGTLYVPESYEDIAYGLGDAEGNRIAQPHNSLTAAMVVPVRDSWKQIKKRLIRRAPQAHGSDRIHPAE